MDGGERQRIGGFASGNKQDSSTIDRIMLRFRPIAPKPAAGFCASAGNNNRNVFLWDARQKRKYNMVRKRIEVKKRYGKERNDPLGNSVETRQLLPETAELRETIRSRFMCDVNNAMNSEAVPKKWSSNGVATKAAESWVMVELVLTDTCMDARWLGRTDVERLDNLEKDTCPGFVSDGRERVQWVNGAYRKLVSGDDKCSPWLVTKEKLPYLSPAFTCQVRLQYTWQDEDMIKTKTVTAPCDVWRMDGGGLAWRLDINAALTLGL